MFFLCSFVFPNFGIFQWQFRKRLLIYPNIGLNDIKSVVLTHCHQYRRVLASRDNHRTHTASKKPAALCVWHTLLSFWLESRGWCWQSHSHSRLANWLGLLSLNHVFPPFVCVSSFSNLSSCAKHKSVKNPTVLNRKKEKEKKVTKPCLAPSSISFKLSFHRVILPFCLSVVLTM